MHFKVPEKPGRALLACALSGLLVFQSPAVAFAAEEDGSAQFAEEQGQTTEEGQLAQDQQPADGDQSEGEEQKSDDEQKKESLEQEKEKLAKRKEELSQQLSVAQSTLASLSTEAELAEYDLLTVTSELEATNTRIAELDTLIPETESQLAEGKDELAEVIATNYKEGTPSLLDVFVDVATFEDFITRVDYANRLTEYKSDVVTQVKDLNSQLVQQRSDLELERVKQEKLVEEQKQRLAAVEAAAASTQAYYDELSSELQDLITAEEQAAQEANLDIAREAIAEALRLAEEQGATADDLSTFTEGSSAPVTPASNASAFVARAFSIIGAGYQWSGYTWTGSIRSSKFTCSGVIDFALGCPSRSHSPEMLYAIVGSRLVTDINNLHYGDLVFYSYAGRNPGHVGIYIGGGSIIDSIPNGGVAIRSVRYMDFIGGGPLY